MKLLPLVTLGFVFLFNRGDAREPLPPTSPWNLEKLGQTPAAEWGKTEGKIQEVYFAGQPFEGKPTRVFAYVGRPEGKGPFPGIVLVHGGGGQAFSKWASHWAERGYVAIAMDTAGNGPGKIRLPDGGPDQSDTVKFRDFDESSLRDMWTYHAVSDVVLAHSLLRSLPEVDPDRTALTGISWGGYLTCITAGVDPRFKAAVPVYGCGFLHDNSAWLENGSFGRLTAASRRLWIRNFDPGQHVGKTKCPILFLNGTNDFAYPLDSYRKTIEQVSPQLVTTSIHHQLPHGHIWTFQEVDTFVDSVLKKATPLAKLGEVRIADGIAVSSITHPEMVKSATLWFTKDEGKWPKRSWESVPAKVVDGKILGDIPELRPIAFFLQVEDERGLKTSTRHVSLLRPGVTQNHAIIPTPKLENDFYDWHKRHAELLRIKHEVNPEIVLIGDSITHMWGGLPAELKYARGAESWDRFFGDSALNLGFGWDRTQNVLWRIDHGELDGISPKQVIIHIGTNNLAGTKNHVAGTPSQIAEGIKMVCERVQAKLPEAKIILMAVFPRGEKPDNPKRKPIEEINTLLPQIAADLGIELLDITDRFLDEKRVFPRTLAKDFLHPTAEGYEIWAKALEEAGVGK